MSISNNVCDMCNKLVDSDQLVGVVKGMHPVIWLCKECCDKSGIYLPDCKLESNHEQ